MPQTFKIFLPRMHIYICSQQRKIENSTYYFYQTDHLGNNRVIASAGGNLVQSNHYYPFGMSFAEGSATSQQPYKYNGKELDTERGLNLYDYSARLMDPALGRFSTVDPLAEKYYWISPYAYCAGNPVNAIDPDGCSTWVMTNSDGTYGVVGGDLNDKDKNIYTYSIKDGNLVRGESIGTTTSMTSFYNSDKDNGKGKEKGGWASGSVINPNDKSGDNFLGNMFRNTPPMFDGYMANAGNGGKYDFKVTNGEDKPISGIDIYRGMPVGKNANGQTIYTSARDVGNMAAGFVAGANGMAWGESRIAFDAYQSKKSGRPDIEGISTRNAEYYGWRIGASNSTPNDKIRQFGRSITRGLKKLWESF